MRSSFSSCSSIANQLIESHRAWLGRAAVHTHRDVVRLGVLDAALDHRDVAHHQLPPLDDAVVHEAVAIEIQPEWGKNGGGGGGGVKREKKKRGRDRRDERRETTEGLRPAVHVKEKQAWTSVLELLALVFAERAKGQGLAVLVLQGTMRGFKIVPSTSPLLHVVRPTISSSSQSRIMLSPCGQAFGISSANSDT